MGHVDEEKLRISLIFPSHMGADTGGSQLVLLCQAIGLESNSVSYFYACWDDVTSILRPTAWRPLSTLLMSMDYSLSLLSGINSH